MSAGKVRASPLFHLTWWLTRRPSMKTLVRMNHKISGVFTGRSTRYDLIESCAAAAAAARGNNTIDNALSWSKTADVRRAHVTRPRAIGRAADNGDNSSIWMRRVQCDARDVFYRLSDRLHWSVLFCEHISHFYFFYKHTRNICLQICQYESTW